MKQFPLHLLYPRQQYILRQIRSGNVLTNRELLAKISKKIGTVSRITLIRDLNDLVRRKYISRIGEGRGVKYLPCTGAIRENAIGGIPDSLKPYFWDTDIKKLSLTKHATYIIERILEWGNLDAVKWLRGIYPEKMFLEVLDTSRSISHKSWHFWKLILSDSNTSISCTRKSLGRRRETAWKY